jgi:hypothetical protein
MENPETQSTVQKQESKGAEDASLGCAIIGLLSMFLFFYLVIAEEVQWENCRHTYYGELKVKTVNKKRENVSANWFSDDLLLHASTVNVKKGTFEKEIASLYVSPKQLKYVTKGQQLHGTIRPFRCASWGDFFKIGYNRYDYRLVEVYAYTDSKGVFHKLKKTKYKDDSYAIDWMIVGIVVLILIINFVVGLVVVPKLNKENTEWKYDVPSWLEWTRILVLLSPTVFLGIHVYELNVGGTLSDHWLMVTILTLLDLIPIGLALIVFSKRKNYLKISSTTVEFYIDKKLTVLKTNEYNSVTISGEYHKDSLDDRIFEFDNGSDKVKFKCADLGMKSNQSQIYKVMLHYLANSGVTVSDRTEKE